MSDKCGFILNDLCCCDEMECYGAKCKYPDVNGCPVHLEPDYMQEQEEIHTMTEDHLREELRIRNIQLELYKKEVEKKDGFIESQTKLIRQMEDCMGECDPFLCDHLKEMLMYED
jgi:hypothetical protein